MASKRLVPFLLSKPHCYRATYHLPPSLLLRLPIRRSLPNRLPNPNPTIQTQTRHSSQSHPPTAYTFEDIKFLATNPHPSTLLIDVREPSELARTGRIPTAVNMPLTSNPDAIFLSAEDFQERFGFPKPGSSSSSSAVGDGGKEVDVEVEEEGAHAAGHGGADVAAKEGVEMKGVRYAGGGAGKGKEGGKAGGEGVTYVVFYCKAGVRSKAAMQMAAGEGGWSGVRVGHWGGGWSDWERRRESVER